MKNQLLLSFKSIVNSASINSRSTTTFARNLVEIAYNYQKVNISQKDFELAPEKNINDIANIVMNNFCNRDIYHDILNHPISGFQDTVIEILKNKKDLDTLKIQILLEYKYIEPTENGYKFRVPIMEKWLRRQLSTYLEINGD